MSLTQARAAFERLRTNKAAAAYLRALLEHEADDAISDDTFLDGIADVIVWLDPEQGTS